MFRDDLKGSGFITTDVNPDEGVIRVKHYLDLIPDEFPDFLYQVKEREEIIAAANQVDDRSVPTFILESDLHEDPEVLKLIGSLVLAAKKLMEALSGVRVTNRIEFTQKFLNLLDELRTRIALPYTQLAVAQSSESSEHIFEQDPTPGFLADKAFNDLLHLIHRCHHQVNGGEKEHFIRIITLVCHDLAHHIMVHREFIRSEIFGHNLNYKIAQNPGRITRVELCDSKGNTESFAVKEIIVREERSPARDKKLMGAVLTPLYEDPARLVPAQPVVYVVWAGTHSKETAQADLEHICPGEASFRRGERQIAEQLVKAVNEFSDYCKKAVRANTPATEQILIRPINIVCAGHSLGGGLAQNTFLLLQRLLAQSFDANYELPVYEKQFLTQLELLNSKNRRAKRIELAQITDLVLDESWIGGLCLSVWSSTRILKHAADYSKKLLPLLASHIQQTAYIGMVGGDPVQNFGEAALFGDLDDGLQSTENKAKLHVPQIYMMKIEPQTFRLGSTIVAMFSSPMIGAGIGYVLGAPLTGGASIMILTLLTAAAMSFSSHRAKHYEVVRSLFEIRYRLFCSRTLDGKPYHDRKIGLGKICEQLERKSYVAAGFVSLWQSTAGLISSKSEETLNDSYFAGGPDTSAQPGRWGWFSSLSTASVSTNDASGTAEEKIVEVEASRDVDPESFCDLGKEEDAPALELSTASQSSNETTPATWGGYLSSFWPLRIATSASQTENKPEEIVLLDAATFKP